MSVAATAVEMTQSNTGVPPETNPVKPDDLVKVLNTIFEEVVTEVNSLCNQFTHYHRQLKMEVGGSSKEDPNAIRTIFASIFQAELNAGILMCSLKLKLEEFSLMEKCPALFVPGINDPQAQRRLTHLRQALSTVETNLATSQKAREDKVRLLSAPSIDASSNSSTPASSAAVDPTFYLVQISTAPSAPAPNAASSKK